MAPAGAGYTNANGYRMIRRDGKSVPEHRVIMEEHTDKKLLPKQNIHHINGVKDDNRISNLEIWDTSQPSGQRIPDKVQHAKEMMVRYGTPSDLLELSRWMGIEIMIIQK
jgi:hypothetical protein